MMLGNNPYPQDERVSYESRSLVRAGYRVAVVCQRGRNQPWHETVHGVEVYRYPNPVDAQGLVGYLVEYGAATAAAIILGIRARLDGRIDAVHVHNPPDTLAIAAALFKLGGARVVFDHHDIAPEMYDARFEGRGNRLVRRALLAFERLSCAVADHVIATNESYRRLEIDRDGVKPENVTVVRNGPNLERLQPGDEDPELRGRAGTLIGFAGIMGYQDGVDHLIRAVAHLVHDLGRTDTLCVLIGKGDARARCQELAAELGIEQHVWFTGFISDADLISYLSTCDVCVVPDPSNPFTDRSTMAKLMEYMALGRPVVAFDLPEHRVSGGSVALYVTANDDAAMARAIADLMDDPDRRREMGEAGRRRVAEVLAWQHSVPNLLSVYEQVLGSRGLRPAPALASAPVAQSVSDRDD
jgi:glycosyltransferase involved in cell wall biosynthesis